MDIIIKCSANKIIPIIKIELDKSLLYHFPPWHLGILWLEHVSKLCWKEEGMKEGKEEERPTCRWLGEMSYVYPYEILCNFIHF